MQLRWFGAFKLNYLTHDFPPNLNSRIETRTIRATADIAWLQERHDWKGLQSIIAVTSKREIGDKVTEETRYFISSLDANDPKRLERVVRAHWAIENNLHWVLNIAFNEDSNRTRKGHSTENLAVIRHIALNLIKAENLNIAILICYQCLLLMQHSPSLCR